jgi:hypothetical protein
MKRLAGGTLTRGRDSLRAENERKTAEREQTGRGKMQKKKKKNLCTGCFKKSSTNLEAYANLCKGHGQCFEAS